jgi:hypothetical protein
LGLLLLKLLFAEISTLCICWPTNPTDLHFIIGPQNIKILSHIKTKETSPSYCIMFLACILEVPSSNLCWNSQYPDWTVAHPSTQMLG